MIVYKQGRALIDGKLVPTDIAANHGRIIEIAPDIVPDEQTEVVDCSDRYLLPALVDLRTCGAAGYNFNTATADEMKRIMEFYISHGVGTVFPTLLADSDDVLCRQLALIAQLAKDYPEIKGVNLEGPFLSPEYTDRPHLLLQKPSMDKFMQYQRAAEGKIRMVTVAPELPDALPFISEVSDSRVIVSLGHSGADGATVLRAVKAGAKSFAHWGRDCSLFSGKDVGVCGAALLSDAPCELACADTRVCAEAVRLLLKVKGVDKVIGVTDSNADSGDKCDAYQGLANVVTYGNLPLAQAVKVWTVNPARLVGLGDRVGTIEVGKDADFIIFG